MIKVSWGYALFYKRKAHMRVVFMSGLYSSNSRPNNRKRKNMSVSYVGAACMIIISDSNFNVTW